MPQRAAGLVLALVGVAAVGVLVAFGADLQVTASRGPRWRRHLLGAGLGLLAALGVAGAQAGCVVTCYAPTRMDRAAATAEQVHARIDLLRRYLADRTVSDETVARTVQALESDLDRLALLEAGQGPETPASHELAEFQAEAKRLIDQAKAARPAAGPLGAKAPG